MHTRIKHISWIGVTLLTLLLTGCNSTSTENPTQKPTITLEGKTDINISLGTNSVLNEGDHYSAYDTQDGVLTNAVQRTHDINFTKAGTYHIKYYVVDSDGYSDTKYRTVTISTVDYEPYHPTYTGFAPTINFTDGEDDVVFVNRGTYFNIHNYRANDFEDGDITQQVTVEAYEFDTNIEGIYTLRYVVTDSDGNRVERVRTIHVSSFTTPYVEQTDIELFKTWYQETCGQTFNESLYTPNTGQYNGTINCSGQNLTNIDLTPLSIFSTIRTLNLSHNNLDYIDFTQLELSQNNVKVLDNLDLSYNDFYELDFTPLFNLKNINKLWIQGNHFNYNTRAKREALYEIFNNRSLTIYF